MVYLKGFFLIGVVVVGMFFVNNLSKKDISREPPPVQSATHTALASLKNTAKTYIDEQVKKEGIYKSLEKTSGQVMGEATQAADMVVEKTTDTITDYVYEHTLEAVIVTLIEKFPARQKELFIERFCNNYSCEK